jgi:hypothetical protein
VVACVLCVTPLAAREDIYDGPSAIRPLTVTPQPQHSAPSNTIWDFEHQCYPQKGGHAAPAAPPAIVVRPITPRPQAPDEPIVGTWRDCFDRAPADLRAVAADGRILFEESRILTTEMSGEPG